MSLVRALVVLIALSGTATADTSPSIDLIANEARWHLTRDGLAVPFTAPGFRKYSQEYARPWGAVVTAGGRKGRVLRQRSAALSLPWAQGGAVTVRVWVHGVVPGQRLEIRLGKKRKTVSLAPKWQQVAVTFPSSTSGENRLSFFVRKPGRIKGEKTYGLFQALELVPGTDTDTSVDAPAAKFVKEVTLGGQAKPALTGYPAYRMWLEVPRDATLRFSFGGTKPGHSFFVFATDGSGQRQELVQAKATGGWREESASLGSLAGQLIALEFVGPSVGAWGQPRIETASQKIWTQGKPYKNAVLLVIDALRADRLALNGHTRVRTPHMTDFAKRGAVVFTENQAASPSSPPSHASIQTGMIPRVHGVVGDKADLKPGTPMISTELGKAGVKTAYYGNNPFGMGRLERPGNWTAFHQPVREGKGIDCTALNKEMLGFAAAQSKKGKRFFISSLPYEPHTPYRYHEGISDRYHKGPWNAPVGKNVDGGLLDKLSRGKVRLDKNGWGQLKALYDGEVEYMDQCFGAFVDGLKKLGVLDDTLIVLTSDHGEGMFEHGKMGHAFGHYAELSDVPLVLYAKDLPGATKSEIVTSHTDIAPTILALMGVRPSKRMQGEPLTAILQRGGKWTPRVVSVEYGRSFAVRSRRWKYMADYQGNVSVFDLEKDALETRNLVGRNHHAVRYLRDMVGLFLSYRSEWRASSWGTLNNHRDAARKAMWKSP